MKVNGWLHVEDNGDNGPLVHFFAKKQMARDSAERESVTIGQWLPDNVIPFELEVDDGGNIVSATNIN